MSIRIGLGNVVSEARTIALNADADFVYPAKYDPDHGMSCFYVRNGEPSCFVGKLLYNLGVTVEELECLEGNPAAALLVRLDDKGIITVDDDHRISEFLSVIQRRQDDGWTWKDSVLAAITELI